MAEPLDENEVASWRVTLSTLRRDCRPDQLHPLSADWLERFLDTIDALRAEVETMRGIRGRLDEAVIENVRLTRERDIATEQLMVQVANDLGAYLEVIERGLRLWVFGESCHDALLDVMTSNRENYDRAEQAERSLAALRTALDEEATTGKCDACSQPIEERREYGLYCACRHHRPCRHRNKDAVMGRCPVCAALREGSR